MWLAAASYPVSLGGTGVALFFVLSGYCIHRSSLRRGQLQAVPYLVRRLWRIQPVLLGALLLTAGLDAYTRHWVPFDTKLGSNSTGTFIANLLTLQGITHHWYGSNGPLWSLGVEVHLYVAYLVLHKLIAPGRMLMFFSLVLLVSVVSEWVRFSNAPGLTLFLPYLFTWSMGMLAAELERAPFLPTWWTRAGLTFVPVGLALWALHYRYLAWLALGPGFAASLVWLLRRYEDSAPPRVFSWLSRIGLFSYSLYAIHEPVLLAWRAALFDGRQSNTIWAAATGVLLCVTAAGVFFFLVERWFIGSPPFAIANGAAGNANTREGAPALTESANIDSASDTPAPRRV